MKNGIQINIFTCKVKYFYPANSLMEIALFADIIFLSLFFLLNIVAKVFALLNISKQLKLVYNSCYILILIYWTL